MIIHLLNKTFHALKLSFFLFIFALLCNAVTPNAMAQSAQPAGSQPPAQAQTSNRKVKLNPPPEYPELARKLKIEGMARVLAVVTADGNVSKVKELGGNPILVSALTQAVKNWKYEPAEHESMVEVRFEFVQQR